jgi:sec-independent protein translocase protein TatA
MFAAMLGGWEVFAILAAILILFGSKKLPELAKGLGQGIREFKKATREVTDEIQNAGDETPVQPQRKLPAATTPRPIDEQRAVAQTPVSQTPGSEPKA